MKAKKYKIGTREFVGGIVRDVYEDADGRQFVYDDDEEPVYGVWLLVDEPTSIKSEGVKPPESR